MGVAEAAAGRISHAIRPGFLMPRNRRKSAQSSAMVRCCGVDGLGFEARSPGGRPAQPEQVSEARWALHGLALIWARCPLRADKARRPGYTRSPELSARHQAPQQLRSRERLSVPGDGSQSGLAVEPYQVHAQEARLAIIADQDSFGHKVPMNHLPAGRVLECLGQNQDEMRPREHRSVETC